MEKLFSEIDRGALIIKNRLKNLIFEHEIKTLICSIMLYENYNYKLMIFLQNNINNFNSESILNFNFVDNIIFSQSNFMGSSITENTFGSSITEKNLGISSTEKTMGSSITENTFGSSITEKNLGISSTEKTMGSSNTEKTMGSSITEKPMGSSNTEKNLGSSNTEKTMGSSITEKTMGSSITEKNLGSSITEKNLGSSITEKNLGSSITEKNLGINEESNNLDDIFLESFKNIEEFISLLEKIKNKIVNFTGFNKEYEIICDKNSDFNLILEISNLDLETVYKSDILKFIIIEGDNVNISKNIQIQQLKNYLEQQFSNMDKTISFILKEFLKK